MTTPIPEETAASGKMPPSFSPEGVDLTLIRWMKSLTPLQRLRALQGIARSLQKLRTIGEQHRLKIRKRISD